MCVCVVMRVWLAGAACVEAFLRTWLRPWTTTVVGTNERPATTRVVVDRERLINKLAFRRFTFPYAINLR